MGVTIGGHSTPGWAVLEALNRQSSMNMTLQPLQTQKRVS